MAVTELDFKKAIDAWVAKTEDRMLRVFKQSCLETVNLAQSLVPVDTGFLRSSIVGSNAAVPLIDESKTNPARVTATYDVSDILVWIAGLELGDSFAFGYTAAYAAFVEYGTSRMAPRGFVARAAGQWQATVDAVTNRAKAEAGAAIL